MTRLFDSPSARMRYRWDATRLDLNQLETAMQSAAPRRYSFRHMTYSKEENYRKVRPAAWAHIRGI